MIYTLTLNPAIDYIVSVKDFELNKTNRTIHETVIAGGKGINVSKMLKNLGHDSIALGFVSGFTGKKISEDLAIEGIDSSFIEIENGFTRINVKLNNYDGTEINGAGPKINKQHLQKLFDKIQSLEDGDILIMSGSVPNSCPKTIYQDIMKHLSNKNVTIIVDSNKELLQNVLSLHPFLIKPNIDEISEIFNVQISGNDQVIKYAKKLRNLGAQNVLVSMGKDGAVLVDSQDNIHCAKAPKGQLVNSVGAGDSMIAGFVHGCLVDQNSLYEFINDAKIYDTAFAWAIASGSATAFCQTFATKSQVKNLGSVTFFMGRRKTISNSREINLIIK